MIVITNRVVAERHAKGKKIQCHYGGIFFQTAGKQNKCRTMVNRKDYAKQNEKGNAITPADFLVVIVNVNVAG